MKYTEQFLKENIGKVIKYERNKHGLTQENLAAKIGIEPKTLSKVETGTTFISAFLLTKLANFFEIEACDFFKFGHTMTPKNDSEKIQAICQMLYSLDAQTLDII